MDDTTAEPVKPGLHARRGIKLFQGVGAPGLFETAMMSMPVFDRADQEELAGDGPRSTKIKDGAHDAVLFRGEGEDGFSLVKAHFGANYILPRHTHDADCLYYVLDGCLVMGSRTISAGDGFFVPAGAPYAYEAGPEGVVILEFRARTSFGMEIIGGQVERLRRMAVVAEEYGDQWAALAD